MMVIFYKDSGDGFMSVTGEQITDDNTMSQ